MADNKTSALSLLAEYHAIASAADKRAKAVEDNARRWGEIAALARRDPQEALRQKQQMGNGLVVHDFGETLASLRRVMKKSAKALKGYSNV